MKRFKLHQFAFLLLVGITASVSSCQDHELMSEERIKDVAYTREFERQFGEIDPNQDWDLFGQLASGIVPVTRAASDNFTFGWTENTMTFSEEKRLNYAKVLPESEDQGRSYQDTNLGQVTCNFMTTSRKVTIAPVHWQTSGDNSFGIFWYVDAGTPSTTYTVNGSQVLIPTHTMPYRDKQGNISIRYIQSLQIMGTNEYKSHLKGNNNLTNDAGSTSPSSANATAWTADKFELNVPAAIGTYGFYITNSDFAASDNTKYSDAGLNSKVSYIENYDPSYVATFNLKDLGIDENDDQQYLCFEDWMGGESNFDMNDAVFGVNISPNTIIDHDATNEQAVLVCEDLNSYDFDFNDVVLGLLYKEEADYYYDENGKKTLISNSQKRTLYVTAMAAGGAFESTVYFGAENDTDVTNWETFGMIHDLMGESTEESAYQRPTGHNPLNAIFNATSDYTNDGKAFTFVESYDNTQNRTVVTVKNASGVVSSLTKFSFPDKTDVGQSSTYSTFLSKLFKTFFFKIMCSQGKEGEGINIGCIIRIVIMLFHHSNPAT